VNAIDLTLLKRDLIAAGNSGTGELKTQTVSLTDTNVKKIGRTLSNDGVTWLVQSGSAVECTVTGTKASVTIEGDGCVYSDEKYRPRYGVYVDGELVADVVMSEPEQVVELFSGSTQRTATVKVMHLSEANNGAIGVKQFDVTSSAASPVKATAKKALSIEFIGDSITCAYGVEADSQYVSFSTGTENFSLSYAYLTAQLLNADYSAVCYSGYGIVSGYSNDGTINTASLVPPIYENTGSLSDYTVPWDFAQNPVDAIVINLGTNDDSYATKDLDTRGLEYQEKYLGKGERNILQDLIDSFRFDDEEKRKSSAFKLQSVKVSVTHDLDDWDLNCSFSITPRLLTSSSTGFDSSKNNGKSYYDFSPYISISVAWRPLASMKTQIVDESGLCCKRHIQPFVRFRFRSKRMAVFQRLGQIV